MAWRDHPVFPLLFGVAFIGWGLTKVPNAMRSSRWPIAEGVVTASAVSTSSGATRGGGSVSPDVRYRYQVGGSSYENHDVSFGPDLGGLWDGVLQPFGEGSGATQSRRVVARYPVGARVSVRYDPSDPSNSVLEPGGWPLVLVLLGCGLAAAVPAARRLRAGG